MWLWGGSYLLYVTTLPSLMAIGIVIVEIYCFWFVPWSHKTTGWKSHVALRMTTSHGKCYGHINEILEYRHSNLPVSTKYSLYWLLVTTETTDKKKEKISLEPVQNQCKKETKSIIKINYRLFSKVQLNSITILPSKTLLLKFMYQVWFTRFSVDYAMNVVIEDVFDTLLWKVVFHF